MNDVVSKIPKMLKNKTNATREISIFLHNILNSRPTITVEKEVMDFLQLLYE